MIVVLTLLGFSLVAGLFIYLTVLDAGRWRKKIETALLPMGFEVCPSKEEKTALAQRLLIVNPRHQGRRLLMNLYRRLSADGSHNIFFAIIGLPVPAETHRARSGLLYALFRANWICHDFQ
ncbi:hypothetical protein [Candidatus Accumulibacter sp. ACC007]|uniref:hypothetical protein n=1 Tax=Candidatus Accumulibacter sp. ACC007 TaxID=2823333 RepID=UPI0025BC8545|nr:hypothetical protein [Candidatus Accumulibacter sp. ACC007]